MKRVWIAALAATCLTVGWLAGGGPRVEAQSVPADRFTIVDTDLGNILLNTRTGDTWKWYSVSTDNGSNMGWQYFALPKQIHSCSADLPSCLP